MNRVMESYDITKLPFTSISRENWEMLKELDKETLYKVIQRVGKYVLEGEKTESNDILTNIVSNQLINVIYRKAKKILEPAKVSNEDKLKFIQQEADRMRENPTEGEVRFKDFCDRYGIEYEFQKPLLIGGRGIILDFSIISEGNPKYKESKKRKIAVEIDGEYHETEEQKKKDKARTKTLKGNHYSVFRLTNEETKTDSVIKRKFKEFLLKIRETETLRKIA